MLLGEVVEDNGELPILQCLHMVFGCCGVPGQDLHNIFGWEPKILGHLMHSVFIDVVTHQSTSNGKVIYSDAPA